MKESQEWFESWFDTKWYHILYKNRDYAEAEAFIRALINHLSIPKGGQFLDAACGAGRHSIQLHKLGYNVNGFDLSLQSITEAKKSESPGLHFKVSDLRSFSSPKRFDAIFNFFTSFGYFESIEDNLKVLSSFKNVIKREGVLLIDFMNSDLAKNDLVKREKKVVSGIEFEIQRRVENNRIVKKIDFSDKGKEYSFFEKVSAFSKSDFEQMLTATGFKIERTFGSYKLDPFVLEKSPRLIILAKPI